MPGQVDTAVQEFLQFYGNEAWKDWERFLAHVDLGDGFSFLVLLLPGAVGADICRRQLASHLASRNKRLAELPCDWREDARRLGDRLFALEATDDLGGIWAGSVIAESDPEIESWKEAWRFGLGSLNQHRNTLVRRFGCPLVLVGAPWLQGVLQDAGPDLWSVRAAVVRVQAAPQHDQAADSPLNGALPGNFEIRDGAGLGPAQTDHAAADPDYALEQAERLRGQPGSEQARAELLLRAGSGFYDHARYDPAESCFREAVRLFKSLPSDEAGIQSELAAALNSHGKVLGALGRREEALGEAEESTRIREELSKTRPEAFLPDFAASLNQLAVRLGELGRREEALDRAREAARIYEQLAGARSEVFRPDLAMALNTLANRLGELGRREEALEQAREAARIYEQLAGARPEAFLPALALSLNNLANRLGELGRREEALEQAREAVRIREQLARARPDAFLPALALSLNSLAIRLGDLGRREEALERAGEAVRIREQLARARPDAFLPALATSLDTLAERLGDLGRGEEALGRAGEAVRIREQLAEARPDVFLPVLAESCGTLGAILREMGRPGEAAASFEKGIKALAKPFTSLPKAFAATMERLRDGYLGSMKQAGAEPDPALPAPLAQAFESLKAQETKK